MSSRLYTNTLVAVPTTLIRSVVVIAQLSAAETALEQAARELDASMRAPDGEVLGRLPAAALRANKASIFDATGLSFTMQTIASEALMLQAIAASTAASLAAANAAASANQNLLGESLGALYFIGY